MAEQHRIGPNIEYQTVYRDIRYPRLEFKTGNLLLILPRGFKNHQNLVEKYREWIEKRALLIRNALNEAENKKLNLKRTEDEFRRLIFSLVDDIARELQLNINRVYFRKMKSKWGSCSSKSNLTVNMLLRYLPKKLIEYVIFHEMAHLIERRHNERFWSIISQRFSDYRDMERDLLVYWFLIQEFSKKKSSR